MAPVAAIILAGGKSSRMGTNKALTKYHDKRLIDWVITCASALTTNIVISTNEILSGIEYPQIKDQYSEIGPLGGIYSGLIKSGAKWNLVLACDMPNLKYEFLNNLTIHFNDYQAIIPRLPNGHIEPLAGWYHHSVLHIIEYQIEIGDYKMTQLLHKINTHYVDIKNDEYFKNVNSPNDLI